MRQHTAKVWLAGAGAVALTALAGCDSGGNQQNFDRGQVFAGVLAGADLRAPAPMAGLVGSADYTGSGFAQFQGSENFTATADLAMTVDFDSSTLSGSLTGWTAENANNYTMDGTVLISNGVILPDGTYDAYVSGNVNREMTALRRQELIDAGQPIPEDIQLIFASTDVPNTVGRLHDNWQTGERATHVVGEFVTPNASGAFAGVKQP